MQIKSERNPEDDLFVKISGHSLADVSVGLCVGGGIAAIEVPKLARELRRRGATVKVFATESALKFIGKDALEWASAGEVVIQPTGLSEHICKEDAVLVFPATTDLIGKAANGICPDACSTYLQSALGQRKPTMFLTTMHDSLRESPAFRINLEKLSEFEGVSFIEPRAEEGKWKSPSPDTIALEVAFRFNHSRLMRQLNQNPRALVTLGGTSSRLDIARTVTNLSTGTLGQLSVRCLLEKGFEVTALCGHHSATLPLCSGLTKIESPDFEGFKNNFESLCDSKRFVALFHLAAVSDFGVSTLHTDKIPSAQPEIDVKLKQLPKLISHPSVSDFHFKIACKFTSDNSKPNKERALQLMSRYDLDAVLWNWGEDAFGTGKENEQIIFQKDGLQTDSYSKEMTAAEFVEQLEKRLKVEKS